MRPVARLAQPVVRRASHGVSEPLAGRAGMLHLLPFSYFFRDRPGLEVDFVVPHRGRLWMLEVKSPKTVRPEDARALQALGNRTTARGIERWVVHRAPRFHSANGSC